MFFEGDIGWYENDFVELSRKGEKKMKKSLVFI
jgi:hypothetical protein